MNLLDFYHQYPDEASCEEAFRRFREHHGLYCSQCDSLRLSWNPSHKSWTCMDCKHEMQLRSDTVMQGSHLPMRDWFAAMFLLTATKRAISAKEIQRQIDRKRYQPVWEMVHKLRDVMGKRDGGYPLQEGLTRSWSFSGLATMVRIVLMYYVDFYSLFNHPERDWETMLETDHGEQAQLSLFP